LFGRRNRAQRGGQGTGLQKLASCGHLHYYAPTQGVRDINVMRIRVLCGADPLVRSRPPGRLFFSENSTSLGQLLSYDVLPAATSAHQ
jgi:hypothetical protein